MPSIPYPNLASDLLTNWPDLHTHIFKTIDSTNSEAKRILGKTEISELPILLVSDTQTGGHGRFKRSFYSPSNTGVYLSLIMDWPLSITDLDVLTPLVAITLRQTIVHLTKKTPKIKWVNDLYLNNKKIAGILCESKIRPTPLKSQVIIGIGLNISPAKLPEELLQSVGSIFEPNEKALSRSLFVQDFLRQFYSQLADFNHQQIIAEYTAHQLLLNREIQFTVGGTDYQGRMIGINDTGSLILQLNNSELKYFNSGEVGKIYW